MAIDSDLMKPRQVIRDLLSLTLFNLFLMLLGGFFANQAIAGNISMVSSQ